jgi:outer membrane protein
MVVRWSPVVAVAILGVASVGRAEEPPPYQPPDFMAEAPPLPAGLAPGEVWRLDLAEALRLAIHGNLGLVIERQAAVVAARGVDVARGALEPVVTARYDHGRADAPPLTSQAGTAGDIVTSVTDDWNLSVAQRLATGTQLEVDVTNSRLKTTSGTAVEPLTYRSTVTLSVTQPLLRGFSTDLAVPRVDVLRAELASEHERQQLLAAAVDVVERTEDAYWDVVQILYRHDLEERSRRRAEDQLALTHRQIAAGLLPPSDRIAAESTLAQRQLQLLRTEQAIAAAWDRLRAVLHLPREAWARPILPVDAPRFAPQASDADAALAIALKHRPELAQADLDLQSQQLAVRKAENDALPQVDLGLSGSVVGQDATYGAALDQVGRANAPGYSVFVNLTWTPLARAATAAAEIERARQRSAQSRREQAIQDVWLAVRDAVRAQHAAELQVAAAAKFRALATESEGVEQRRFLSGQSTNFLVAQRQEELASAQLAELTAVLDHKKATAALLRATGQLLDARHVELVVAPGR